MCEVSSLIMNIFYASIQSVSRGVPERFYEMDYATFKLLQSNLQHLKHICKGLEREEYRICTDSAHVAACHKSSPNMLFLMD